MATREETKRMIEVMQAYVDGAEIEFSDIHFKWKEEEPNWNWIQCEYRVKQKEPNKTKLVAFIDRRGELRWIMEHLFNGLWTRVPSEDKDITM